MESLQYSGLTRFARAILPVVSTITGELENDPCRNRTAAGSARPFRRRSNCARKRRRDQAPAFTKQLSISASGLDDFVERPVLLLKEIIRTLDPASRAAIALVFMRGGWLASPVSLRPEEENAIGLLGASGAQMRGALTPLDGSLLMQVQQKGQHGWRARHPTVLDAFASLVAESRELMDIYLAGTPVRQLLSKVGCGDGSVSGIKVEVPADRYDGLIGRISAFHAERRENQAAVDKFLAHRCGADFLRRYLQLDPGYIGQLRVWSYFYAVTDIGVLNKLHAFSLLSEEQRIKHVDAVRECAISTPDSGFLEYRIVSFLTGAQTQEILRKVREELLPRIEIEVDDWKYNYSRDDPANYFEPLKSALSEFGTALSHDTEALALIDKGVALIDKAIAELEPQHSEEPDYDEYYHRGSSGPSGIDSRSIFDDVDN
jgi:hypothetical protein